MTSYNKNGQLYVETGMLGIGLEASLLQTRERVQLPKTIKHLTMQHFSK